MRRNKGRKSISKRKSKSKSSKVMKGGFDNEIDIRKRINNNNIKAYLTIIKADLIKLQIAKFLNDSVDRSNIFESKSYVIPEENDMQYLYSRYGPSVAFSYNRNKDDFVFLYIEDEEFIREVTKELETNTLLKTKIFDVIDKLKISGNQKTDLIKRLKIMYPLLKS
jgi:hypothetical protein